MNPRADQLPCLQVTADGGLLLRLHVQPRAAHNQVAGLQGEALGQGDAAVRDPSGNLIRIDQAS